MVMMVSRDNVFDMASMFTLFKRLHSLAPSCSKSFTQATTITCSVFFSFYVFDHGFDTCEREFIVVICVSFVIVTNLFSSQYVARNILRDRVGRLKVADFYLGQILKAFSESTADSNVPSREW